MKFKILYITLLAIISILMYYINFEFIYNYYSYVGPNKEFGDLDLLLRGIDHFRNGENPFLIQEKTPFNYPSTWSFFSLIDVINRDNLRFIGVFITFLTFLLLLCTFGSSQKVCGHNILRKIGSLIILGDLNIISQTKGRISRFLRSVKVF